VTWHPNGMLDTITYGSGLTYSQGLDANHLQRPARWERGAKHLEDLERRGFVGSILRCSVESAICAAVAPLSVDTSTCVVL
jgi:hypothetical protein